MARERVIDTIRYRYRVIERFYRYLSLLVDLSIVVTDLSTLLGLFLLNALFYPSRPDTLRNYPIFLT